MRDGRSDHGGKPFEWSDPFFLEDQLGEEEILIRDSARAFVQERLLPEVADAYLLERIQFGRPWRKRSFFKRSLQICKPRSRWASKRRCAWGD